jgi:NAD(P)-dependent dehydrogenase (short-subunit alcohol dehydrogenase family)
VVGLSESDTQKLFDAAGDDLDLAIYNAGNNTPGKIVDMDPGYFEEAWRVVCFGGFLFGREALRRMLPKKRGTILFTGASASLPGRPNYGAFNSAKAGLRTLAQAMAKELRRGWNPCRSCHRRRRNRWGQNLQSLPGRS